MSDSIPAVRRTTLAVVLAGGSGSRMGAAVPKQLLDVGGKPVIRHTLEAFEAAPEVDAIVVVMAPGRAGQVRAIAHEAGIGKLVDVIGGGASRGDSSRAAVEWATRRYGPEAAVNVLLHDAARMLVSGRIIADVTAALERDAAVTAAVASADTVVEVDSSGGAPCIAAVPDRDRLRRVQTPQGFHLPVIRAAYAAAADDPSFTATDDCSVVLRFLPRVPVRLVPGDERNLKVTAPADLAVAAALLEE